MPLSKPNLIKPRIGGDLDVWGGKLNENIDKQDAFNASIVEDSSIKDQELSRLEMEKVDKDELNTFVKDVVDNYIEDNVKPELNNHVETVNKPDIDNYVSGKKSELNQYVETVSKIEINNYTDEKKSEINNYTILKKTELNEHTETKKTEINDYTLVKKTELDEYEKEKELELNNFTTIKKEEITSHTNNEISNITNHTESKKIEINDYTNTKKDELNSHTTDKKNELNIYVDTVNKVSLDEHEKEKEKELDLYNTNIKKPELDTYEKEKEKELKSYADTLTVEKNQEITNHTNEEIERVIGAGLDGVWNEINNKLNKDDSAKSAIKLTTARKINGVSFDGTSDIVVKAYPVPEAIVNDLVTGGTDNVLSAEMGKLLKELIEAGGGGTNFNYVVKTNPNGVITASGILTKGTSNIVPNTPAIFKPMLFIEGDLVPENLYSINESGTLITLNFVYSNDVDAEWFIYDHFPSETKFSIATVNLLVNSPLKNGLELGDVIRIQGELNAYDGGAHLRIVENSAKLNAVDLGGGLWLNEVPQSRVSNKTDSGGYNQSTYALSLDVNTRYGRFGHLPSFTTYGEFCSKVESGQYILSPETISSLKLPAGTYEFGVLDVKFCDNKQFVSIIYIRDGYMDSLGFSSWNFANSPNETFKPEQWQKIYTTGNNPVHIAGMNGYSVNANGTITQWGTTILNNYGERLVFNIAFKNNFMFVATDGDYSASGGGASFSTYGTGDLASVLVKWSTEATPVRVNWIAIGY